MRVLVTGSTGQIGSELVPELAKRFGKDNIIATTLNDEPNGKISSLAFFDTLDVTDKEAISRTVTHHGIDVIYHLAGILSAAGEENPELAYRVNLQGLHNMLEVARQLKVKKMFWPSSIAVFGPNSPRTNAPQESSLVPNTMYGVTKVAGELMCNYYFSKYGLDVRSVRYPGIISSETLPSGGTTDYAVEIFYGAIKEKQYISFVRKNTVLPMLYMPDCIKAMLDIMDAETENVKIRTSYSLAGISFSVEELANEIRKHIPEFIVEYKPDSRQRIADSWPMSVDDRAARSDWGWTQSYDLSALTTSMIEKLASRLDQSGKN